MPKLPVIKPRNIQKFLLAQGFSLKRSVGSHFRYSHPDGRHVTVAFHNEPIKKGTLKSILHQANCTVEDLINFL